jgi:hypothetical protein
LGQSVITAKALLQNYTSRLLKTEVVEFLSGLTDFVCSLLVSL